MLSPPTEGIVFKVGRRLSARVGNFFGKRQSISRVSSSRFALACRSCSSILLPHASHYSAELVNLLLRQEGISSLLPEGMASRPGSMVIDFVDPAIVGPYLEVTILFLDKNANCSCSVDSNSKIMSTHLRNSSCFLRHTVHRGLQVMKPVSGVHILLKICIIERCRVTNWNDYVVSIMQNPAAPTNSSRLAERKWYPVDLLMTWVRSTVIKCNIWRTKVVQR